jgi:ComEC/Rec2-related protein
MQRFRFSEETLLPVPCFPVLYFFLATSLPLGLLAFDYVSPAQCGLLMTVVLVVGALIFPPRRGHVMAGLLGLAIAGLHLIAPWRTYEQYANEQPQTVLIDGIVIDEKVPMSDALDWLGEPRTVRVKLNAIRLNPRAEWEPCKGVILMRDPTPECTYGAHIEAQGRLEQPFAPTLPGSMHYRNYLKTQGIQHILWPTRASIIVREAAPSGRHRIMATLFRAREAAVVRMLAHLKNDTNREVLAAMTVGMRHGLDPDTRTTYIRSGMIHLFAISGLHVGIIYAILLGLAALFRIPFSTRYLALPVLLIVYVAATGAAPSAMRAWLMLTVWSVGRGLKRPVVATNTILVAALALLMWNPYAIFHSGFQFSFVIVLCLVWGWQRGRVLLAMLEEKRRWVPAAATQDGRVYKVVQFLSRSLASMTCAWLGGIGLTAFYNGLFLPVAVLTNTLVCLGASVIIALALLQLGVSFVGGFVAAGVGWLLELSLTLLRGLASIGADYGGVMSIAQPSLWMVALYYVLLLLFFSRPLGGRRRVWLGAATAASVALMVAGVGQRHRPGDVTILLARDNVTPVILVNTQPHGPILINTGGKRFGRALGEWLSACGFADLDTVVVLDNRVAWYGGLASVAQKSPPRRIAVVAPSKRGVEALEKTAWDANSQISLFLGAESAVNNAIRVRADRRTRDDMSFLIDIDGLTAEETLRVELHIDQVNGSRVKVERPAVADSAQEWEFRYSRVDRMVVAEGI